MNIEEMEQYLGSMEGKSLAELFSIGNDTLEKWSDAAAQSAHDNADGLTMMTLRSAADDLPELMFVDTRKLTTMLKMYYIVGFLKGAQWKKEMDRLEGMNEPAS